MNGKVVRDETGDIEPLWTAAQVARLLGMSKQWVYRQAEAGTLPAVAMGGDAVRFEADRIRLWMERRRTGQPD